MKHINISKVRDEILIRMGANAPELNQMVEVLSHLGGSFLV